MLCRIAEPCNACYDNIYDQLNFEIKKNRTIRQNFNTVIIIINKLN